MRPCRILAAALLALACVSPVLATPLRLYVDVAGSATNVPRSSSEPARDVAVDAAHFPLNVQVKPTSMSAGELDAIIADAAAYLHVSTASVSLRWAKRVTGPTGSTVSPPTTRPPPTTTTTTLPCEKVGDNCGEKDGSTGNYDPCCDGNPCGPDTTNNHRRCHEWATGPGDRVEGESCGWLLEGSFLGNGATRVAPGSLVKPACIAGLRCDHGRCVKDTTQPTATSSTRPAPTTVTTTVPTSTTSTTSTTLQTGRHTPAALATGLSLTTRLSTQDQCRWMLTKDANGNVTIVTATQAQLAEMQLAGWSRFLVEALRYAKHAPGCANLYRGSRASALEGGDTKLRTHYPSMQRDKSWEVNSGCEDYFAVVFAGRDLAACVTSSDEAARYCATSTAITGDILDWADLRIDAGRCVRGARFTLPTDAATGKVAFPKFDKVVAMIGLRDYRVPVTPPDAAQRALLAKLLMTHHLVGAARCGEGPMPSTSVRAALLEFIDSAKDERQKALFQMQFTGAIDNVGTGGWGAQDVCDLSKLQGIAMTQWAACFDRPAADIWDCVHHFESAHAEVHRVAALRNGRQIRVTCGKKSTTDCDRYTTDTFLACQTGALPNCRVPWVPDPITWRVLVPEPTTM